MITYKLLASYSVILRMYVHIDVLCSRFSKRDIYSYQLTKYVFTLRSYYNKIILFLKVYICVNEE